MQSSAKTVKINCGDKDSILDSVLHFVTTLKNKGASKGSSSDAIEEPLLVPQRTIQSKVL